MKNITCIEDLRQLARRKVPRAFFDYVEAGSYSQETLRFNREDMQRVKLRQRVLVDMMGRDLSTTIIGEKVALPFALSPVAMTGLQHGNGEILAARAANAAGIPFGLSTMSICSIEDVAEATGKPFWFQLYVMRDRGFVRDLIARAQAARCSALVLTVDLQVLGQRHCDVKNGLAVPPEIRLKNIVDMATKPAWVLSVLKSKRKTFGNLAGYVKGKDDVKSLAEWTATQFDQALNWKDIDWIKSLWPGKLILKGILDVEDAKLAARSGASALVVSNHGGRQLDGAPSSISVLPKIADAIGSQIEILFDGGIRSGQDMMRALGLGAKGCLIGRAYQYGLGAGGEAGVAKAIDILRTELDVTMALCGVKRVADIDRRVIAEDSDARPRPVDSVVRQAAGEKPALSLSSSRP
ncbi:MAG: alpha-hydroxy-acid oxidizing protein [Pseudomonadota bacterium]|nr:alpha-hydroxy-acid oxidizing protein [Pseudomonadota bacterium]